MKPSKFKSVRYRSATGTQTEMIINSDRVNAIEYSKSEELTPEGRNYILSSEGGKDILPTHGLITVSFESERLMLIATHEQYERLIAQLNY